MCLGYYEVVGIPQQCIDGVWTTLCDDGTNSLNAPNDLCRAGGAACQYKGHTCRALKFIPVLSQAI